MEASSHASGTGSGDFDRCLLARPPIAARLLCEHVKVTQVNNLKYNMIL